MPMHTKSKRYVSQFSMMGTIISLTLFEQNQDAVESVYDYLAQMDRVFSANRGDSELSRINQQAGVAPVTVSDTAYGLIQDAIHYTRKHADSFNVLMGPLVKLWKIGFGGAQVPPKTEIAKRLTLIHSADVVLNENEHSVYLAQAGMQLDLGAIAKGYFADQISQQLQDQGITSAIIDLGGNVQILGTNPATSDGRWQIGIQDPQQQRGRPRLQVQAPAKTFVTSGIRERHFEINGRTYHHILDPQTGFPVTNDVQQVTIITDNSELAEVLSTVCFFKGCERGLAMVEGRKDVEAIFIDQTNAVHHTSGLTVTNKGVFSYE